jgi:Toxin PAAR-like domain
MSKNVFANGREVSAEKDDNRTMGAMPDVCLSPPSPPAGPVPVPYPNFAQSSDTDQGARTVLVGGGQVGIKNKSTYKKSNGDEAATKSLGMGLVSHQIQNTMYFAAWSFDVKFESQNAVRHMDLTTHNNM